MLLPKEIEVHKADDTGAKTRSRGPQLTIRHSRRDIPVREALLATSSCEARSPLA